MRLVYGDEVMILIGGEEKIDRGREESRLSTCVGELNF